MNELYTRKMIVVLSSVETTDVNFYARNSFRGHRKKRE